MRKKEVCMLGRLPDISDTELKEKIERAPNKFIKFLCECLLKIVNGNVPIRKSFIESYEKSLRKLLSRQTGLKGKSQLFAREKDLVQTYLTKSKCAPKNSF